MNFLKLPAHRWLIAILVLSVMLRVCMAFYLGNNIEDTRGGTYDQISYDMLAQRVAQGYGFSFAMDSWPYARANQPTAFWSYLYTLFLAAVYTLFGSFPLVARLIQAVAVGCLMPWLIFRISCRMFGRRTALFGAMIVAVYAYFIAYAASLMTESFYIVGILWTVDVAMRCTADWNSRRSVSQTRWRRLGAELGAAMAVTLLLRQVVIVFFGVMVLWLLWIAVRRRMLRSAAPMLLLAGAIFALLISPFVIRNYLVFGQIALPNTNAGFTFFWSNHPIYGTQFEAVLSPSHGVSYQDLIPVELRDLNEAQLDRALLTRGLRFVREDPLRYLLLSLSRIPVYFQFWPTAQSTFLSNGSRLLSFGLFLPFMLHGLALSIRNARPGESLRRSSDNMMGPHDLRLAHLSLILLFLVVYTAVHLASWANVRYRLPVDAFLILFAAHSLNHFYCQVTGRKNQCWEPLHSQETPGSESYGI